MSGHERTKSGLPLASAIAPDKRLAAESHMRGLEPLLVVIVLPVPGEP